MAQMPADSKPTWAEMGPPMGVESEAQRFDFLGMLLRRKGLVVFGLLVGVGLGALFYYQQTPMFGSVAKVMITPKDQSTVMIPMMGDEGMFTQIQGKRAHGEVIKSSKFVESVLENTELSEKLMADVPSLRGISLPTQVEEIRENIDVTQDKQDENIYFIEFKSAQIDEAPNVLDALLEGYGVYLNKQFRDVSVEIKTLLSDAEKRFSENVRDLQNEIDALIDSSIDELALRSAGDTINIEQERMAEIDRRIRALRIEKTELQTQLDRVKQLIDEGQSQQVVLFILEQEKLAAERSEYGARERLQDRDQMGVFQTRLELERMLMKFGEDHPGVKALRADLDAWQRMMAERGISIDPDSVNVVELYQVSTVERIRTIDDKLAQFTVQFEEHRDKAKSINATNLKLQGLLDQKKQMEEMLSGIVGQLQQIDVSADKDGFNFELLEPPSAAEQVEPSLLKVFAVAGFLGILLGVGLAYMVDMADKTFRSPDEISTMLALPIVGHLPYVSKSQRDKIPGSSMDDTVFAWHRPKSTIAEGYRAVRTALFFTSRESNKRVIQVTSPSPGDGKSTLIVNLAVTIAQAGKKVLLVDADLRRPRQHTVVGEDADLGFAALLRGDAELPEVVLPTEVDGLFFIPCGTRPSNPAELLTSPRLVEFIELAKEKYDYVLIDTPPLLAVTDPATVAPRVDTVILTFRIRKNVKIAADRSREILTAVGADIMGVVVNGIGGGSSYSDYKYGKDSRAYAYKYRYAQYGGYAPYGYGYGYGYGYDNFGAEKYYDEGKRKKTPKSLRSKHQLHKENP